MKKKLLAAAVAGAFALPGLAFAQSAVTISGYIKVGLENINIGNAVNRANTSEMRLVDSSSRIDFHVKEDLGGGLAAIGLFDVRYSATTGAGGASGNDWVGLESNQWGRITIGRRDLHYYHTADTIPSGSKALDAWSVGVLGFVPTFSGVGATTGTLNIANDTRTNNVIEYASPKWGMFEFGLAYSTDPYGNTGSMITQPTNNNNKAYAWNFAPQLRGGNWVAGYSYYKSQAPATSTASTAPPDERSDRLWGYYVFPQGFRVGLTWDRSSLTTNPLPGNTSNEVKRNAWSLPLSYSWGPNSVGWTHTVAQNVSVTNAPGFSSSGTGAKLDALYYQYALSKRTQMGVTYARMNNDTNAAYNLFTSASGGIATSDGAISAGEDPRIVQFTLMHSF